MKEYVYRKHLREPIKFLIVIMVVLISMILEIGIISGLREGAEERGMIIAIFSGIAAELFIFIGLELLVLYHIMFKKFKNIKVSLNDEGITYHNIKGTQFEFLFFYNFYSNQYLLISSKKIGSLIGKISSIIESIPQLGQIAVSSFSIYFFNKFFDFSSR